MVRHGRTTKDQLEHSLERLEAVDAKALGVVINLAPSRKNRLGYGYGYGYGYGFETEADTTRGRGGASNRAKAEAKAAARSAKRSKRSGTSGRRRA